MRNAILAMSVIWCCSLPRASGVAFAQLPATQPAPGKVLLEIEILAPQIGSDPLQAQRWRQVFEQLNEGVRIRQPLGSDRPSVSESTRGPFRVVKIVGALGRNGELVLPNKTFTADRPDRLQEWLNELRTYGAQGSPAGQPMWGLSEAQFKTVHQQLSQRVTDSTKGLSVSDVLSKIPLGATRELVFHSSAEGLRGDWKTRTFPDELQGLTGGTALACLLSQQGLGFRPLRTPQGEVELVVHPLAGLTDAWPIGWPVDESLPRNQLLPGLFEMVETGVNSAPLSAVLDAVESKSHVRILLDWAACAEKRILPGETLVSYPRKRTAWALIVKSVAISSHLTVDYRQDEAGTGFLWITPVASYTPKTDTKTPPE